MTADHADANREVARTALEQVCSHGDMTLAPKCYAEDFAEHAGSLVYHGLVGVERSTALYRALFDDLGRPGWRAAQATGGLADVARGASDAARAARRASELSADQSPR